jgi:predicted lactoylglutathione lyase
MPSTFPQPVPEIPVSDIATAAEYYLQALGFHLDWSSDQDGICGISQGNCRFFLANPSFRAQEGRENHGNSGPVVIWLNLESKTEVDELYQRWRQAGARILAAPEDKPWNLREFTALDPDGNKLRVFYDFTWELRSN